jgi:hypothetical protein
MAHTLHGTIWCTHLQLQTLLQQLLNSCCPESSLTQLL